jgi:hypothetical protein
MAKERSDQILNGTGFKLEVRNMESECKPDVVLRNFINFYSQRDHLVGVLGPGKRQLNGF